ncbi:MAG: hypothetical protein JW712_05115 [Dehalococcoidales bacterium]|nr:hypothetical protein [Dehalococcoidales bacterium]
MRKIKPMLPWLIIIVLGYFLLPLLGRGYGVFLVPVIIFGCSILYGLRNSFHWTYLAYALTVAVLFVPPLFIYFNTTALMYIPICGGIALVGSLTGRLFGFRAP